MLEQIQLCDKFIFYDDVQYSRGGFINRVQIKTASGMRWMSLPLQDYHLGQHINEVIINESNNWRIRHREMLHQAYSRAPYVKDMLKLVDQVFMAETIKLSELTRLSMMALIDYFELQSNKTIFNSSEMGIRGSSSQRVLAICESLGATRYVTGHGARNYLDHNIFKEKNINVDYMDYRMKPYRQLHGAFTPFVTSLDLVANCGKDGVRYICSDATPWQVQ